MPLQSYKLIENETYIKINIHDFDERIACTKIQEKKSLNH